MEGQESLRSSSEDESAKGQNQFGSTSKKQETALLDQKKEDSIDQDDDSQIEDMQEKNSSQKQSDDQSFFQYDDQVIDEEDKQSDSSREQDEQLGRIVEMQNQDQNVHDDDEEDKIQSNLLKNLEGPKIRVSLRDQQKTIFQKSQDRNSIVYLPTGLGKTRIAIASMYYYLSYTQKKKIVFLANTVQLVKQQAQAIKRTLLGIVQDKSLCKQINKKHAGNQVYLDWNWDRICREVVCIHGQKNDQIGKTKKNKIQSSMMSQKQFMKKIQNSTIIIMISQMFLNCLRRGFIKLTDFSFVVFDECHHCKGDHPYAGIMNEFYFDIKKRIQKGKNVEKNQILPKIMGLTASPIPDPQKNEKKLQKMIQELCINLDSNFVEYQKSDNQNETKIKIIKISESQEKQENPWLLNYFAKHNSHWDSYKKIEYHFPLYFQCVRQVIGLMSSKQDCLKLNRTSKQLHQAQLFFFYDIKECLLNKIKDLWLQLGQYVMCLAIGDLITQLNNIKGLKDENNQQLLNDIIKILLRHEIAMKNQLKFKDMLPKYFSAKLIRLIQLLTPQQSNQAQAEKIKDDDKVLVFAFKRRTVEYLDKFFEKYRQKLPQEQRKYFQCTGVTGYSSGNFLRVMNEGSNYENNPSSQVQEFKIGDNYNKYLQDYQETMKNTAGVTSALQNQLNRFKNAKVGKFLLQTEQKYSSQLRKITQFRKKQKRVLISTSVTEEGFDIPGCNIVISFDTPFCMKAYIQIKGRARKKNSIYYIFTTEVNDQEMNEQSQIYDDTINATYQIAINRIAKKQIRADKKKQKIGYKKVATKGGALLNSNYALQILKIYFTTLAQPNKGYFHYIQTPNICFKCVIKMPQSDPSGIPMFVGQAYSTKDQALKSVAFNAVKQLKILGLIKDDLRPSKIHQLEDQYQLQKYNDLGTLQRDQQYRQIFRKYAQFQEQQDKGSNRSFLRMYFQSIRTYELDFPKINPKFSNSLFDFNNKGATFPFQLYIISFSNTHNHPFMKEFQNSNQVGILTCFDQKLTHKLFANFCYKFQENQNEYFTLKKVNVSLQLSLQKYVQLRQVHQFLAAACDNREIIYYIQQTENAPQNSQWKQIYNQSSYLTDKRREFYPLLVLLKSVKSQKKDKKETKYEIDYNKMQEIKYHNDKLRKIYKFNNRSKLAKQDTKLNLDLTQSYESFADNVKDKENITLIQSITSDFMFHKCIIKNHSKHYEQTINDSKKLMAKYNLEKRQQKFLKTFQHFKSKKNDLIQRQLWRSYEKEKRLVFFDQGGIKQQVLKNDKFYFLKEFVQYPLSPQTLFKVTLAKKYTYDALNSYSKALSFINIRLSQIFNKRNNKYYSTMFFSHYENILLANADLIFEYLSDNGKSKLLRELGRSYKSNKHSFHFEKALDKSQFPNLSDISGIQAFDGTMNNTQLQQNSVSGLNVTKQKQDDQIQLSQTKNIYSFDQKLIEKLKVPDIQKVLTSKTYKHQKGQNYEEFEFIGDVVLKYLATLQIFCTRPKADEGQMHIARANIICNANLHKKAIQSELFRYIMASKSTEPCPPYKITYDESKIQRAKYTGKNNEYESLNIMKKNNASQYEGFQYIAGKTHADVVQALIGAFYYSQKKLEDCQQLLYALDVLKTPSLKIDVKLGSSFCYDNLPRCYQQLQSSIGYIFRHKGLLIQALTHQTFRSTMQTILDDRNMSRLLDLTTNLLQKTNFNSEPVQDYRTKIKFNQTFYQRLQFLGDSVLDLIVVQHLYEKYDRGLDEGTLSLLKQAGVSNRSLGLIAVKFKLHELTLMDIPELDNLQKQFAKLSGSFDDLIAHPQKLQTIQMSQIKLLGDVFQGLIGAILVDNDFNYQKTKQIVWKMIGEYIKVFTDKDNIKASTSISFLNNNNYTNCRIEKISKQTKNGKFRYGMIDRKHTIIQKCFAANQKDAWDIIMDKLQAKKKGLYDQDEDLDESQ